MSSGETKQRIELKGSRGMECMRRSGAVIGEILEKIGERIEPGITTKYLDDLASKHIKRAGAAPAFLGYRGFPACICASLNEEVVHGIPSKTVKLKAGDIISIDIGIVYDGYVGDIAATFPVGEISEEKKKLLSVTHEALFKGIAEMRAGGRLGDVSSAIQEHIETGGYGVVRDFVGHGVGRNLHEEPSVPNFGRRGTGIRLEAGMVLALEPMVTVGDWRVKILDDGWTVVTLDGKPSAHFEHMVAITESGPEILTKTFTWNKN